jgi:hypothetical protein
MFCPLLEVEAKLNLDLHALDNLAKQWLVDFNPQKTEYMVISFRQNINPINLKFNSENLNQVDNQSIKITCLQMLAFNPVIILAASS